MKITKIDQINRRQMMTLTARAAATAGLTFSVGCRGAKSAASGQLRPAHPRGFKIGVCDWKIKKASDPAALKMAQRLGFDGVQISMGTVKNDMHLRKPEIQEAYRRAVKKYNVEVASLAIGELNKVPYKSDSRTDQWVADSVDVCKAMGLKVCLLAFFGKNDLRGDKKGIDVVVKKFKQVAPKAEKAGVSFGIESWLSAEEHMDIIERVGSSAIKVYYDVGNSHKAGYDIYKEIRFLGKHICEFHAKDYQGLFGKGSIDFKEVRRAMDEIGYRGWIQWEGVKKPLGLEGSCQADLKYLRPIFPLTL